MTNLISIKTLKTNYLFDQNLDDKFILSNIVKVQDFKIKPIITEAVFDELIDRIDNDLLDDDDIALLEKIEPCIAYYVMSEAAYASTYKLKNYGLDQPNTDRFAELIKVAQRYEKDGDRYCELLIKFINKPCTTPNITEGAKTGIYFGSNPEYLWRKYKYNLIRKW